MLILKKISSRISLARQDIDSEPLRLNFSLSLTGEKEKRCYAGIFGCLIGYLLSHFIH